MRSARLPALLPPPRLLRSARWEHSRSAPSKQRLTGKPDANSFHLFADLRLYGVLFVSSALKGWRVTLPTLVAPSQKLVWFSVALKWEEESSSDTSGCLACSNMCKQHIITTTVITHT